MAYINEDERKNRLVEEIQPAITDTQEALQILSEGGDDAIKLAADIAEQSRQRVHNANNPKPQQSPIGVVEPTNPNKIVDERQVQQQAQTAQQVQQAQRKEENRQRQLSRNQQAFDSFMADYKNFVETMGREPEEQEFNTLLQGRRLAVQSYLAAMPEYRKQMRGSRAQTIFGGGGMFGDVDRDTMNAVRSVFAGDAQRAQSEADAARQAMYGLRNFSQRGENGAVMLKEGEKAGSLSNGKQVTNQDVKALNALFKEDASPERDAAIANVLKNYFGITLDGQGTIEQQIDRFRNSEAPARQKGQLDREYQDAINKHNGDKAALDALLAYSGASVDEDGNVKLPAKMTAQQMREERLEKIRRQDELNTRMQQAALQRAKTRQGWAELANVFGDMIQASGGAKVFPRDLKKEYDKLTDQQKGLYDAYQARTLKLREDLDKQNQHERDLAAAADEAAKKRAHDLELLRERGKIERNLAWIRANSYNNNKEPNEYTINFANGKKFTTTDKITGENAFAAAYRALREAGVITDNEEQQLKVPDGNGGYIPITQLPRAEKIRLIVSSYMPTLIEKRDWKTMNKVYKYVTGEDYDFRDPLSINIDKGTPAPNNVPPLWVEQNAASAQPEPRGAYGMPVIAGQQNNVNNDYDF